jgi:hypothetical protein
VLSFPNFYLSEFLTPKKHRQDSYLDNRINFYVCSLWIQHFSAIPRTVCHLSRSITSWTSFLQRCHLRNIVFLQEDHPLNCPFCLKIFYNATFTLMNDSRNNVRKLWVTMSVFPMSTQNFIAAHCSALFKKHHFSNYDDLAMINSNPDNSAILKL